MGDYPHVRIPTLRRGHLNEIDGAIWESRYWVCDRNGNSGRMQGSIHSETVGAHRPLRIAMVAPPWISIPAPAYGGIEEVVRLLCQGSGRAGERRHPVRGAGLGVGCGRGGGVGRAAPGQIEDSLIEAAHVGSVFGRIDRERLHAGFDVVHDHCPAVALAMADRLPEPFVHTLHGPFDDERTELYRRQGHKATLVAISESQRSAGTGGRRLPARGAKSDRPR